MDFLPELLQGFDPACVLATIGALSVVGLVAVLRSWVIIPSFHEKALQDLRGQLERETQEKVQWRDIALPSLQISNNLTQVVQGET